jgi:hypothetical protein
MSSTVVSYDGLRSHVDKLSLTKFLGVIAARAYLNRETSGAHAALFNLIDNG